MDATAFWNWVRANRKRFTSDAAIRSAGEPAGVLDELSDKLQEVDGALTLQFTSGPGTEPVLAIGCDGDEELIENVQRLVAAAGEIEGLRVVAFAQRISPKELELELGDGFVLKASEMWFRLSPDESHFDRLALKLFVKAPRVTEELAEASVLMVEAVLGEYALMTGIGDIDVEVAPAKRADLWPLEKLASTFDGWDR